MQFQASLLCFLGLLALVQAQCGPFGAFPCRRPGRRPPQRPVGRPGVRPVSGGGGGGSCPRMAPHHNFQGKQYVFTWRNPSTACNKMSFGQAQGYCQGIGMRAVSLDTRDKANEMINALQREGAPYFWSSGQFFGAAHNQLRWANGVSQFTNGMPFSNTGGLRRPQPDNREGDENCLAVLNNFYNDGVKFHDVSCHHKKPTICESL